MGKGVQKGRERERRCWKIGDLIRGRSGAAFVTHVCDWDACGECHKCYNVELLAGVYGNDFLNGFLLPFNEQDIGHCSYKQVVIIHVFLCKTFKRSFNLASR